MSLTPLDESEGRTRDGDPGAQRPDPDGPLGGLWTRARSVAERVVAALRGAREPEETPDLPDRRSDAAAGSRRASKPVVKSGTESGAGGPPSKPVVADEQRAEPPELEAEWEDGDLTISEPDAEEARISSDTWTDVER